MKQKIAHMIEQAAAAHRQGRLEDALAAYRSILDAEPGHPDANYSLGLLTARTDGPAASLPFFRQALESNPKQRLFWLAYIEALGEAGQPDGAMTALAKGKSLGLSGADIDALERRLSDVRPQKKNELQQILNSYQSGRFDEAEARATAVINDHPENLLCWQILAAVFHSSGRKIEALDASRRVVEIDPSDAEAQSNLGSILLEMGNLEEAEACFRSSIALNSDLAEVHNNLAVTLLELCRFEEAEAGYREAISLKPDYAEAHSNLGNVLKELGRIGEAEECHSRAIAANPSYVPAYQNRGQTFFETERYEEAIQDFEVCNTEDSRTRILSCLYALGRIEDIYETIAAQADIDRKNIGVAALSAFIATQQGRVTANNFCPNPLDYLHFSNLAAHVANPSRLIADIIEELGNISSNWEPRNRSTHKGFQSKINLFDESPEHISVLKDIIVQEIDIYRAKYKGDDCLLIREWPADWNLRSWYVVLKQQGYQDQHIHPSGWLSGVVYLKVVPSLDNDEGAIQFDLNGESYKDSGSPKLTYQPNSGDIVFFPSSLHHRTIPFTSDMDRIIISFDLRPN